MEGEDNCGAGEDFTIDFDDRGMDSDQNDGTDWGSDDGNHKCGRDGTGASWFVWFRPSLPASPEEAACNAVGRFWDSRSTECIDQPPECCSAWSVGNQLNPANSICHDWDGCCNPGSCRTLGGNSCNSDGACCCDRCPQSDGRCFDTTKDLSACDPSC